jgi:PAS domain S-box-containing protein/putative nucleotidyltransferase with HDIG domain
LVWLKISPSANGWGGELWESEERFRLLADNAPFGISIMAPDKSFVYFNPMFTAIFGYTKEDISDKDTWFVNGYPDAKYRKKVSSLWQRDRDEDVKIGGKTPRIFTVRCKNGQDKIIDFMSVYLGGGKQYLFYKDITDRAMAEEALKHSEERYRTLVENIDLGINLIDADHNIIMVNATQSKRFKKSINEMIGKKCFREFQKRDSVCQNCIGMKAMVTGQPVEVETEGVRNGQGHAQIRVQAFPVLGKDGTATAFIIIVEDITERKLMEEALQQSEANLKKAQEVGHIGSWHLDLKKNELIWSDETCRIFGIPQETVFTYERFLEAVHPDDREHVDKAWTAALDKELYDIEHRIVVNGKVKWVRERAEVELDDNIKGIRATGTVQDITDLKRAEEKLRESEERYRSLVESSTDAIVMLDHDENVITCNQAFLDLFGYQGEEIVGKEIRIIHPSDESAQKFREAHYQTLERSGSVRTEWEYMRKDGTSFPAELVISLISSNEETIIGCISIIRDITERKRADEKLKASFDTLRRSLESTISALASALELRDPYTAGHQQRVTDLACAIAGEMELGEEQIAGIRMAGLIHDIGKINIPAEILNKPGQLTEIEYNLFKNHPQLGHDILKTVEFPWPVAQIVLQHHERMDGSGYPQGLSGEEIILGARILAVADIVEAIASHRPYRPARGIGDALEEILHNKGILYDPAVVDACLRVFYDKGFTFEDLEKAAAPSPKIH